MELTDNETQTQNPEIDSNSCYFTCIVNVTMEHVAGVESNMQTREKIVSSTNQDIVVRGTYSCLCAIKVRK